jgi:hypothetical protein
MAIYTLTAAQIRGAGIYNGFIIPSGGGSLDPDAQAFLTATAITDPTISSAINTFVVSWKNYGLWTKSYALYPLVGGTSSTHKFNLKDPRDLDAAYRLGFNGGWTHASTGATPNGVNAWANTFLVSQGTLGLNSTSFGVYSRTNLGDDLLAPSIGNVTGGVAGECSLWLRYQNSLIARVNTNSFINPPNADSRGLILVNRVNSTQVTVQIRGTQTTLSNASNALYTQPFQLGGVNPNFFDNKQLAFAFIMDGLTSQNMTDANTAIVAFQTALSRNV